MPSYGSRSGRVNEALRFCLRRKHLRRSLTTAAIVGVVLTLINHGDAILAADVTGGTWVKVGLNFVVPFVVTNVGMLASRAEREPWEGSGGEPG